MATLDPTDEIPQESALRRVAQLPLVHSAAQIVSFAYRDMKTLHPLVDYACSVSERGVKSVDHVASYGLAPILRTLGPQINMVSRVAVRVVDGLEVRLPVLDQPADEVVSDLKDNLLDRVSFLRQRALTGLQKVLDRAQTLVKDTREAVTLVALSFGSLGVRELVGLGAELTLIQAGELMDHYLPDEENTQRSICPKIRNNLPRDLTLLQDKKCSPPENTQKYSCPEIRNAPPRDLTVLQDKKCPPSRVYPEI
ncbi:perilipin-1-like [Discoglossus pictus]